MTDTQDLITRLRAIQFVTPSVFELINKSADKLEAAQAEIERLTTENHALGDKAYQSTHRADALKVTNDTLKHMKAAALARLAEVERLLQSCRSSVSFDLREYGKYLDRKGTAVNDADTGEYARLEKLVEAIDGAAAGASPAAHVPETDCGNIEAMQPNSCAYCTHPLFVGLKCKHCGRVVQPSQAHGRTNSGDETGGAVERFGWATGRGEPEIIPATNGAFVWYSDYLKLWKSAQPSQAGEPDASAKTWCEYVAGMVGCYLGEPVESDKCKAISAIIFRRLWALPLQTLSQAGLSVDEILDIASKSIPADHPAEQVDILECAHALFAAINAKESACQSK